MGGTKPDTTTVCQSMNAQINGLYICDLHVHMSMKMPHMEQEGGEQTERGAEVFLRAV